MYSMFSRSVFLLACVVVQNLIQLRRCTNYFQVKHLQFVSGVRVSSFWISSFVWDLLNAMVPVMLSVILFAAFQVDGYTGDGLAGVFLLLVSN